MCPLGNRSTITPNMRFSVQFLGCKVSHADAREVREALLAAGHEEAGQGVPRDLAVISSCCVTAEALAKSRKAAARATRGASRVVVGGCGASLPGNGFAAVSPRVEVVPGGAEAVVDRVGGRAVTIGCTQADRRYDRVRAFVKIQDGCSFRCEFCVIPLVRGASRSRGAEAVLAEVRRRVEQGHREVVLTGINLGCYRDRAAGYRLPQLVREVGATPGLARLRLSSIEVNHLDDELLAAIRETPNACRHLHVPLQAGDDGVLESMSRRYSARTYLRKVAAAQDFNL